MRNSLVFLSIMLIFSMFSACSDDNKTSGYAPDSIQKRTIRISASGDINEWFAEVVHDADSTIVILRDEICDINEASCTYQKSGNNTAQLVLGFTMASEGLVVKHHYELTLSFNSENEGVYSGNDTWTVGKEQETVKCVGSFAIDADVSDEEKGVDFAYLVGNWQNTTGKITTTLTFNQDKTYAIKIKGQDNMEASGAYSCDPGKNLLFVTLKGESKPAQYKVLLLTEDELEYAGYIGLEGEEYAQPITFTKIENGEQGSGNVVISKPVIDNITYTSALVKGSILGDKVTFTERGVCYSTNTTPTVNDKKITQTTDIVNTPLTDLFEGTTYYVRLYAKIGSQVRYGEVVSFKTEGKSAASIQLEITKLTPSSVNIKAKLPNSIKKYGLCYGTSPQPKITDSYLPEQDRNLEWCIYSLKEATTYYVRAYHIEGTNIVYYTDSETKVETIGKGIKLSYSLSYKSKDYFDPDLSYMPDLIYYYMMGAVFHLSYTNLPKGTYGTTFDLTEYYGWKGTGTRKLIYHDGGTGVLDWIVDVEKVYVGQNLTISLKCVETNMVYEFSRSIEMAEYDGN